MIRIPTGPIPAKYARSASLLAGVGALLVSFFKPAFSPLYGSVLTALGITLGDASKQ
jgi:hypothetical protein